jgi:hypothetical protein
MKKFRRWLNGVYWNRVAIVVIILLYVVSVSVGIVWCIER